MNYAPPKRKHFAPPTKLMNPKSYFRIHSQGNNQRNIDYLDQCTLHSDIEMPKKNLFWIYTFNSLAPSQTNDLLPTNKQVSSISHFCHWPSRLGLTQRSFDLNLVLPFPIPIQTRIFMSIHQNVSQLLVEKIM